MDFWKHIRKHEYYEMEILFSQGKMKFCMFFTCTTITFSSSSKYSVGHPGFLLKSPFNSDFIIIKLNESLLKCLCFTARRHVLPHRNMKILQLAVSGDQQFVTFFGLLCPAFVMPSVGKCNWTLFKLLTSLLPSVKRKSSNTSVKPYLYMPWLMLLCCNQLTEYLIL